MSPHSPRRLPAVTIIGAGLGGLSAAIHLRLAGHPVRILERNPTPGGRANRLELDSVSFDTGPTLLNYPWVFEDLFRRAGKDFTDYVDLLPVEPTVAYCWTDGRRLTLSRDPERLRQELEAFENGAAAALDRFLADAKQKFRIALEKLVPQNQDHFLRYFGALSLGEFLRIALWRSMYSELGRFFRSRYIREALGSYAMYLGGSPFELPGTFSILPYGELAHGLWLPRGGIYALVEAIVRLARELGVEIQTGCPVERILTDRGRVRAVRLAGNETLPAELVVCNADWPAAVTELLAQRPPRLAMSPAVVTYYWLVRERPPGLGHHTIFLPADYRGAFRHLLRGRGLPPDPAFYVAAPPAPGNALAPSAQRLFVLVPVPTLSRLGAVNWAAALPALKEQILRRMFQSDLALSPAAILSERIWTPLDWKQRFCLFDGSAFGAAHTITQIGPFRPRNYSRRVRGLYFVGASTNPGTGLPMVVISGRLVAERIASHVR
jgi:phytoene desaturase